MTVTDSLIDELVDKLRELPDGTEISVYKLIEMCGYDAKKLAQYGGLADVCCDLRKAARRARITLGWFRNTDTALDLPGQVPFIIRKNSAYNECPFCRSRNTARILYGMPAMDEELEAKVKAGKVCLGGCCVTMFDPKRYCNDCGKEF